MMFTAREKHEDAMREVKLRRRVYERMVNVGDSSKSLAERRIAIMEEIASEYKELANKEDLFLRENAVPRPRPKAHRHDPRPPDDAGPDRNEAAPAQEHQQASPTQTD